MPLFVFLEGKVYNSMNILVIADEKSQNYIDLIINNKDWGYRIWGIMTDSNEIKDKYGQDHNVIIPSRDLKELLDHEAIDEVIYCKIKGEPS